MCPSEPTQSATKSTPTQAAGFFAEPRQTRQKVNKAQALQGSPRQEPLFVITSDQILRSHLSTSRSASAEDKREILLSVGMDYAFLLSIEFQGERSLARKPDL